MPGPHESGVHQTVDWCTSGRPLGPGRNARARLAPFEGACQKVWTVAEGGDWSYDGLAQAWVRSRSFFPQGLTPVGSLSGRLTPPSESPEHTAMSDLSNTCLGNG